MSLVVENRMITQRLKIIFGLSIPLFVLHGIEEYRAGFYQVDELYQFVFRPFLEMQGSQATFIVFQIMFWFLLSTSFLLIASERWRLGTMIIIGLVYILELEHIWKTVISWSYYPGLITALPLYVVGFFLWKELLRVHSALPTRKI